MKIYFEDGSLKHLLSLPEKVHFTIDATNGVRDNINFLDDAYEKNPNFIIYTNSILAFSNKYAWNKELKVPEIYIRAGEHMLFTRIDKLTMRELREAHNLAKLYIAGEFDRTQKEIDDIKKFNDNFEFLIGEDLDR